MMGMQSLKMWVVPHSAKATVTLIGNPERLLAFAEFGSDSDMHGRRLLTTHRAHC